MAKVKTEKPDHLTIRLFAPGMSLLHRAGLGGLACTLNVMRQQFDAGLLPKAKLPAPFQGDTPPWEINEDSITLRFGKPENAAGYLKKLFAFAFQIKDDLIYLPGQSGSVPPPLVVRAAIQDGIQNTFLQHGPTCGSREGEKTVTVEINDTPITITHDVFTSYKHQGWFWLDRDEKSKEKDPITGKKIKTGNRIKNHQVFSSVNEDGTLREELHDVDNKLIPGGMVRHDRFAQSAIRETDSGLICLHFTLIGCLTLSINRVTAVLLIPEVSDLFNFIELRPWLTPQTVEQCRIAGAADAALQAQIRLRARDIASDSRSHSCFAMTCRPTQWNKKQKPRVATVSVTNVSETVLDRFERALAQLPPRLVVPRKPEQKKNTARSAKKQEPFWSDSVIRPMIADNLTHGRPWYEGFSNLMTRVNPATNKPFRNQLHFEQKGLNAMIADSKMWDQDGEKLVVQAVHEAMRMRYGRIADENKSNPAGMKNRMERFRERLRLGLAGAKTESQVRFTLTDLFSRSGNNSVLRGGWEAVLPVIRKDWQLARDLGLLALASYVGTGAFETPEKTDANT